MKPVSLQHQSFQRFFHFCGRQGVVGCIDFGVDVVGWQSGNFVVAFSLYLPTLMFVFLAADHQVPRTALYLPPKLSFNWTHQNSSLW